MSRPIWLRVFLVIWLALVIVVSISPLSFKLRLHSVGRHHAYAHYLVYLLTGFLLWLVASRWYTRIFTFVLGLTVAVGQEWMENKIYHAGFEWKDVITDLAGLISGYVLMLLIMALMSEQRARQRSLLKR